MAEYDSRSLNRMLIPYASARWTGEHVLVVHEAVHAAMDMRSVPLHSIEFEIMGTSRRRSF
jgi:hypothetical protein